MKDSYAIRVEARIFDGDSFGYWNHYCEGSIDVAYAIMNHFEQAEYNGIAIESISIYLPNGEHIEMPGNF